MKKLSEIDSALTDVIWSLLDYPEYYSISSSLIDIERRLDTKITEEEKPNEAEVRFKA